MAGGAAGVAIVLGVLGIRMKVAVDAGIDGCTCGDVVLVGARMVCPI